MQAKIVIVHNSDYDGFLSACYLAGGIRQRWGHERIDTQFSFFAMNENEDIPPAVSAEVIRGARFVFMLGIKPTYRDLGLLDMMPVHAMIVDYHSWSDMDLVTLQEAASVSAVINTGSQIITQGIDAPPAMPHHPVSCAVMVATMESFNTNAGEVNRTGEPIVAYFMRLVSDYHSCRMMIPESNAVVSNYIEHLDMQSPTAYEDTIRQLEHSTLSSFGVALGA